MPIFAGMKESPIPGMFVFDTWHMDGTWRMSDTVACGECVWTYRSCPTNAECRRVDDVVVKK